MTSKWWGAESPSLLKHASHASMQPPEHAAGSEVWFMGEGRGYPTHCAPHNTMMMSMEPPQKKLYALGYRSQQDAR